MVDRMERETVLIKERKRKLEEIRKLGIESYPYRYDVTHHSKDIKNQHYKLVNEPEKISMAGRLMTLRLMGKIMFADLMDGDGKIQIYFSKKTLGDGYGLINKLDIGDFIGASGTVFKTKTGEITLNVENYQLLCKSLRPLPEKYHGLKDPNLRYRQRSLDLIANPEVKEIFKKRSQAITAMRQFLDSKGFLEVETPTLQPVYGGASARPFVTHINALDQDFYLSVSPELYLKRLIVGGFEKAYTICKNFRNEGIDKIHNPEFTMMECYQAYVDYNDMMDLTENMYEHIFNKVNGSTKINYQGTELDFKSPWQRIKMLDAVRQHTNIDPENMTEEQLRARLKKGDLALEFYRNKVPLDDINRWSWGELVAALFEFYAESKIIQPTFVIDHPKETTPLCKLHRTDCRLIERFEPFVYGYEIGNAYSELNDPVLQRTLLEKQASKGRGGDETAHQMDEDFCQAIEYGMPPTGGLGLGIDRLVMFLTNQSQMKDVILFPLMKY